MIIFRTQPGWFYHGYRKRNKGPRPSAPTEVQVYSYHQLASEVNDRLRRGFCRSSPPHPHTPQLPTAFGPPQPMCMMSKLSMPSSAQSAYLWTQYMTVIVLGHYVSQNVCSTAINNGYSGLQKTLASP